MVLSKQELITALRHEAHILVHLVSKVEAGMVDYRPTASQRSTLELLRYLTMMGPAFVDAVKAGSFSSEAWTEKETAANQLDFAGAKASLAGLGDFYEASLSSFTDEELRSEVSFFGSTLTRGAGLVQWVLGGHAAYRTQLFCYLKSCGREELNTMNLWAGVDGSM